MSKTIELPEPLFREINGYAVGVPTSPLDVIQQAWEEFRQRHPQQTQPKAATCDEAAMEKWGSMNEDEWSPANPPPPLHLGTLRPTWTSRADLVDELYER